MDGFVLSKKDVFQNNSDRRVTVIKLIIRKLGMVKKPRLGTMDIKRRKSSADFICILFIILAYSLLFIFFKNKVLFTPDFGESDAYHLNLSLKYYLADELKHNRIPFWTNALEGGYPLFSEAQIGALFLPNLFFLKFFNFVDGYNLLYISALFFLTCGFYLLLREFDISSIISLLFSLIFTFNGSISLRWVHLNLLQSFSLLPLLFYMSIRVYKTHSFFSHLFFLLIVAQMIFAGHMQIVFIALLGLCLWVTLYIFTMAKKNTVRFMEIIKLGGLILGGFILSLPQILPNYLLAKLSNRSIGLDYDTVVSFPFNWQNLITFVKPFAFGNQKLGTYAPFSSNWGIFWENTPYLGIAFFLMLLAALFLNRKSLSMQVKSTFFLAVFFILLALGKNSPLYFIFNFPPFNFFRTPSKYLLIANLLLVLGTALLINRWFTSKHNFISGILIILISSYIVFDLFSFSFHYHLFIAADKVFKQPESVQYLNPEIRYVTYGQGTTWNKIFINRGWNNQNDVVSYLFLRNFLYPDSNLIFARQVYDLNTGTFHFRRSMYVKDSIKEVNKDGKIHFEDSSINLMKILGVGGIISDLAVENQNVRLKKQLSSNSINIFIYDLPASKNSYFYVPKTLKKIEYLSEFEENLKNNALSVENSVAENVSFTSWRNSGIYSLTMVKNFEYKKIFSGDFSESTFIAFRQNIYPEWSITIDGRKTAVYPVNLVHMGIIVPKGKHTIIINYNNSYFKIGLTIALIFFLAFLSLSLYKSKRL